MTLPLEEAVWLAGRPNMVTNPSPRHAKGWQVLVIGDHPEGTETLNVFLGLLRHDVQVAVIGARLCLGSSAVEIEGGMLRQACGPRPPPGGARGCALAEGTGA